MEFGGGRFDPGLGVFGCVSWIHGYEFNSCSCGHGLEPVLELGSGKRRDQMPEWLVVAKVLTTLAIREVQILDEKGLGALDLAENQKPRDGPAQMTIAQAPRALQDQRDVNRPTHRIARRVS